jgi:hypothetical protein
MFVCLFVCLGSAVRSIVRLFGLSRAFALLFLLICLPVCSSILIVRSFVLCSVCRFLGPCVFCAGLILRFKMLLGVFCVLFVVFGWFVYEGDGFLIV